MPPRNSGAEQTQTTELWHAPRALLHVVDRHALRQDRRRTGTAVGELTLSPAMAGPDTLPSERAPRGAGGDRACAPPGVLGATVFKMCTFQIAKPHLVSAGAGVKSAPMPAPATPDIWRSNVRCGMEATTVSGQNCQRTCQSKNMNFTSSPQVHAAKAAATPSPAGPDIVRS